jgi:hypothetical protein
MGAIDQLSGRFRGSDIVGQLQRAPYLARLQAIKD